MKVVLQNLTKRFPNRNKKEPDVTAVNNFCFEIPVGKLPALAFSCAEEFELYHNDELHYFYPTEEPKQVARWALAVDLMAERRKKEGEPNDGKA